MVPGTAERTAEQQLAAAGEEAAGAGAVAAGEAAGPPRQEPGHMGPRRPEHVHCPFQRNSSPARRAPRTLQQALPRCTSHSPPHSDAGRASRENSDARPVIARANFPPKTHATTHPMLNLRMVVRVGNLLLLRHMRGIVNLDKTGVNQFGLPLLPIQRASHPTTGPLASNSQDWTLVRVFMALLMRPTPLRFEALRKMPGFLCAA